MEIIISESESNKILLKHFYDKGLQVDKITIASNDSAWENTILKPLVKDGNLIAAIRAHRAKYGSTLADAKAFVEDFAAKNKN